MNNIIGIESVYREAIDKPGQEVKLSSELLVEIIERTLALEQAYNLVKLMDASMTNGDLRGCLSDSFMNEIKRITSNK